MTRASSAFFAAGFVAACFVAAGSVTLALVATPLAAVAQQARDAAPISFVSATPAARGTPSLSGFFRGAPGTNTASPHAYGPGMGDLFVGFAYQPRTRAAKRPDGTYDQSGVDYDGSVSLGFGLGDAHDGLGLTAVVTSLSALHVGFATRGAFSFQVFRHIDPTLAIAVGVENAVVSGGDKSNENDSWYGVVSKAFQAPAGDVVWLQAVTVSAGLGNGRFRLMRDVRAHEELLNVFGSVSALVHDQVTVIADWTGQDLNVSASIVPFKKLPVTITPSLADIVGLANNAPRFVLAVGLGMHF